MTWLLHRLREPSTWRGIVWMLTVAGWSLRPDQAEAIIAAGMALAGVLGVFLPDAPPLTALPPIELQGQSHVENDPDLPARGGADRSTGPEPDRLRLPLTLPPQYPAEQDERVGGPGPGWNG